MQAPSHETAETAEASLAHAQPNPPAASSQHNLFSQRHPFFYGLMYRFYRLNPSRDQGVTSRVTPAGWLVLLVFAITALLGVDPSRSGIYQVFSLMLGILLVSQLSLFFVPPRVKAVRHVPHYGSAGHPLRYKVTVTSLSKRAQLGLSLRERIRHPIPSRADFINRQEPGESERNIVDRFFIFYRWRWLCDVMRRLRAKECAPIDLLAGESKQVELEILPLRRGVIHLTRLEALRPDVFGLIKRHRAVQEPSKDTLIVLPKRYPLPDIDLPGTSEYHPNGVVMASSIGQAEEFMSLREYRPGDPIRHMHWKSWARTGTPIIKEYVDEYLPRYALVLDTFASFDPYGLFEEAVSVAASFACTLDTKENLLELLFVGTEAFSFTSGRGTSQTERMLEILAGVDLCRDARFETLAQHVKQRSDQLSCCICVLLDWDEPRREFIKMLRQLGVPVLPLVICVEMPAEQAEGAHYLIAGEVGEGLACL